LNSDVFCRSLAPYLRFHFWYGLPRHFRRSEASDSTEPGLRPAARRL